MIKTSFQKKAGNPSLGILFCWKLTVEADPYTRLSEPFIPELFFDFFFIRQGEVNYADKLKGVEIPVARQALKTIHTQPLTLTLSAPLILFGVRLSLSFAESFWEQQIPANQFLAQNWVEPGTDDLQSFTRQVSNTIEAQRSSKAASPMLSPTLEETEWFAHFSPRHKRRLYKSIYGISRKELGAIQGLHVFLGQTCDFSSQSPRIIEYIDSDVFYDQPHFNHLFRKMTDLSPLEYLQASSVLQDNLMAASYNEIAGQSGRIKI